MKTILKKIEDVLNDSELDYDMKLMLISTYLRIAKSSKKKGVK